MSLHGGVLLKGDQSLNDAVLGRGILIQRKGHGPAVRRKFDPDVFERQRHNLGRAIGLDRKRERLRSRTYGCLVSILAPVQPQVIRRRELTDGYCATHVIILLKVNDDILIGHGISHIVFGDYNVYSGNAGCFLAESSLQPVVLGYDTGRAIGFYRGMVLGAFGRHVGIINIRF